MLDTKTEVTVQFSVHERLKILESYVSQVISWETPCRETITKIVEKFRNTRCVGNDNKGHSGWYVAVRTRANVQAERKHLEQSPQKSTRRLSQEVGISRTTVQKIIHNDLKLFPYKVKILQKQTDVNKEERSEFF